MNGWVGGRHVNRLEDVFRLPLAVTGPSCHQTDQYSQPNPLLPWEASQSTRCPDDGRQKRSAAAAVALTAIGLSFNF